MYDCVQLCSANTAHSPCQTSLLKRRGRALFWRARAEVLWATQWHCSHFGSRYLSGCCCHTGPFSQRFDPACMHFAVHIVINIGVCSSKTDPPRIRTWNLQLQRPTPYPLGQRATCVFQNQSKEYPFGGLQVAWPRAVERGGKKEDGDEPTNPEYQTFKTRKKKWRTQVRYSLVG